MVNQDLQYLVSRTPYLSLDAALHLMNPKTTIFIAHFVHETIKYSYVSEAAFSQNSILNHVQRVLPKSDLDYDVHIVKTDLSSVLQRKVITAGPRLDDQDYYTILSRLKLKLVN